MKITKLFPLLIFSTLFIGTGCTQGANQGTEASVEAEFGQPVNQGQDTPGTNFVSADQEAPKNLDARIAKWAKFVDLPANKVAEVKSQIEAAGYTFNDFNPAVVNVLLQFDPNLPILIIQYGQGVQKARQALSHIDGSDQVNFLSEQGITAETFRARIAEDNRMLFSLAANFRIFQAYFAKIVSFFYDGIEFVNDSNLDAVKGQFQEVRVADPAEMLAPFYQLAGTVTFGDGNNNFYTFYQWTFSQEALIDRTRGEPFLEDSSRTRNITIGRFFVTKASENMFPTIGKGGLGIPAAVIEPIDAENADIPVFVESGSGNEPVAVPFIEPDLENIPVFTESGSNNP